MYYAGKMYYSHLAGSDAYWFIRSRRRATINVVSHWHGLFNNSRAPGGFTSSANSLLFTANEHDATRYLLWSNSSHHRSGDILVGLVLTAISKKLPSVLMRALRLPATYLASVHCPLHSNGEYLGRRPVGTFL